MLGLASGDCFVDTFRNLQGNLLGAVRAAETLQHCYNRDVASRLLLEASDVQSQQQDAVLALSEICVDFKLGPAAGATEMVQMQRCFGDEALVLPELQTPPIHAEDAGDQALNREDIDHGNPQPHGALQLGAELRWNLRRTWRTLSSEDLQAYMPRTHLHVQLQPALGHMARASVIRSRVISTNTRRQDMGTKTFAKPPFADQLMFDPDKPFRLVWSVLAISFMAYDSLMVPLQAFDRYIDEGLGLRLMDLCVAIYWTVDIAVSFRTGYFYGTVLETRPSKVAMRYVKTWFSFDIMMVAMEWFGQFASTFANASVLRVIRIARFTRVTRLLRLLKIPKSWKLIENQINSNFLQMTIGVCKTVLVFCVVLHVLTCLWFSIGANSSTGWITYGVAMEVDNSLAFWYFASSRWVLAQINGRTDMDERRNMQERLFTCLVAVAFAVVFMSIFLSSITAMVVQLNELSAKSNEVRTSINAYLQHHQVSMSLVASVKRQLVVNKRVTILQEYVEREKQVLALLPDHLGYDLLYEIRAPMLSWHGFFCELERAFPRVVRHVCLAAMRPEIVHQGQEVFDEGDPCSRMLFVDEGKLVYTQRKASRCSPPGSDAGSEPRPAEQRIEPLFSPSRKRSMTRGLGRAVEHVRKVGTDEYQKVWEWRVYPGMWISEGALWIQWENLGQLLANTDSLLMALDAGCLSQTLLAYRDAYAMSAIYARQFAEELWAQERASDLIKVELICEEIALAT